MKLFWKLLLLCAGLALFGWYVSQVGFENVWRAILSLGGFAPLVLLPYLIVYVFDCLGWARTFPAYVRNIGFLTLLRIRWCGEAINNLVPSAYVGGEALKVLLLRNHGVSASNGATSAVVSKTAQTLAQLVFILLASVVFLLSVRPQAGARAGIIAVCVGGCLAVAGLFWIQSVGIFRMAIALLERFRIKSRRLESRKAELLEIDTTIVRFYRQNPKQFYGSALLYLCGWTLGAAEIFLVAKLLEMPISISEAVVLEAFTGVAKIIGMWIPGSLGVQESGIVLAGRLAGLPDTLSTAYAVIRRIRELIFAGFGLLLLYMIPDALKQTESPVAAQQD